jgi:hypothetical protein
MPRIFFSVIIFFLVLCTLSACNHKSGTTTPSSINIEMFGTWRNDSGCVATFTTINDRLVLAKFTNGKKDTLSNIILLSKKVSIMTTFKPQNAEVDFSGSFLEGVVIINTHCTDPLHKVDSL